MASVFRKLGLSKLTKVFDVGEKAIYFVKTKEIEVYSLCPYLSRHKLLT